METSLHHIVEGGQTTCECRQVVLDASLNMSLGAQCLVPSRYTDLGTFDHEVETAQLGNDLREITAKVISPSLVSSPCTSARWSMRCNPSDASLLLSYLFTRSTLYRVPRHNVTAPQQCIAAAMGTSPRHLGMPATWLLMLLPCGLIFSALVCVCVCHRLPA